MNLSTEAAMFHDALLRENEAAREMIRIYRNDRNLLLAALREVTRCLAWHVDNGRGVAMDAKAVTDARAAIARAEGTA